jgi:hypothetical protein
MWDGAVCAHCGREDLLANIDKHCIEDADKILEDREMPYAWVTENPKECETPNTHGFSQRSDGSWYWTGVDTSRKFSHNLAGIPRRPLRQITILTHPATFHQLHRLISKTKFLAACCEEFDLNIVLQ